MKNDFKHSDKNLRDKLSGFHMPPPENAWAGIEGAVGGKASGRRRFFFLWLALLFIGAIGAGILTLTYFNTRATHSQQIAQSKISASDTLNNADDSNNSSASKTWNNTNDNTQSSQNNNASTGASHGNNTSTSENGARPLNANNVNSNQAANNDNAGSNNTTSNNAFRNNAASNNSAANNTKSNLANLNAINSNTTNDSATANSNHISASPYNIGTNNNATAHTTSNNDVTNLNEDQQTDKLLISPLASRPLIQLPISSPGTTSKSPFQYDQKITKGAWSLEAGFDISSFSYIASGTTSAETLNNSYTQSIGQGAFLRANYRPIRYLTVHTGFEFNRDRATQEYSTFTTTSFWQADTVGYYFDTVTQQQLPIIDSNFITSQVEQKNQVNSQFSQVSLPVGVMFHVPLGTRSELGVNLSGIVGIRTQGTGFILADSSGATVDAPSAYKSVNFSARGAIRYTYLLNEHFAVYAEPYLGFGLNNRSNATLPFTSRFRNSGLRVGLRYNF